MSWVKHCSKGYLFSYQTFDSLDILISTELSLVFRKFKLHQGNWHGREVRFSESVHVQKSKREQTHLACLHAAEKYGKVESVNTQNDLVTVKNEQIKRKQTCSLCFVIVLMCLNSKKAISRTFKRISRK